MLRTVWPPRRSTRPSISILVIALACLLPTPARADVILQYFEGRWETIERRMPDIFMAGYDALWVPPPGIADSGGFSVGYDVFDRFNLGEPFRQTLYGTTGSFSRMSDEFDRAGVDLFIDAVLNHNGFRDLGSVANDGVTPFEEAGSYPGFVVTLPSDIDGDFHGIFEGGDLNGRLAGLIDIAQEKNHLFTRHPVPGVSNNIPNETPRESNRRFYPDRDLPEEFGRHPFNLADPLAGDPVQENATGLLLRYMQWLVEVQGVDGFRLDAVKHMPTWFFNNFYDGAVFNVGRDPITGDPFTPFSFGEALTGDFGVLAAYSRKDGFGNRDVLDFPLFFAMRDVFGANGFGDMRRLEGASFDGVDGNPNDGTFGVQFAGSHDDGTVGNSTVAYAYILTRTGFPLVYYNAREFGENRDFPKDGRGDALGNFGSDIIPRLVRIHDAYATGPQFTRWIDDNVYIYERLNSILVGLNDRGDAGFDQRTVFTGFAPGTILTELTGNATSSFVDPNDDIFDTVTVDGSGNATIRVPRARSFDSGAGEENIHNRGFVVYGLGAPQSTLTITNATGMIPPDPEATPEARKRLTPLEIVTGDTIDLELTTSAAGPADDNALVKFDFGLPVDANDDGTTGVFISTGRFAGFEQFTDFASPREGGGSGEYRLSVDATGLEDGVHYIETVAFRSRPAGAPAVFDIQRRVVYLDRQPPAVDLLFPTQTGSGDIQSSDFEAVVSVDRTADNVNIVFDTVALSDQQVFDAIGGATNARRHDRLEWRRVLGGLTNGTFEIAVVAFESTGTSSLTRFGNINVQVPQPEIFLGVDNNDDPGATDFQGLPGFIEEAAFGRDIVIRVDTDGGTLSWNEGDFDVSLQVDDGPILDAQPFDPDRPINTLFQNDQAFGDGTDEFRFIWRGYTTGNHTFRARAQIAGAAQVNEVIGNIFVSENTPGPAITITNPAPPPPVVSVNNPAEILVEGTFDTAQVAFARAFIDLDESGIPLGTFTSPVPANFSASKPVGSFQLVDVLPQGAISIENGTFPIRVIGSTGPNGTGIVTEVNSELDITGVGDPVQLPPFAANGDASDLLSDFSQVLAVSAADGGSGTSNPADFGAEGTLTELRARVDDSNLFVAVRGEMFGASNDNLSLLLIDVNAGSGQGVTDLAGQLDDTSDGLRAEISRAPFLLDTSLVSAGIGIDVIVAVTTPTILAGYTLGSDGLPGSTSAFEYQGGIVAAYDGDSGGIPGAPGTTIDGPSTLEVRIPVSLIGNPDPANIRLAAVTASDAGFPSPNTLPENSSNDFTATQTLEEMAALPVTPTVLINEVLVGDLGEPNLDMIELFNPGAGAVDLSGWALRMNDNADERRDFVIPDGVSIPGGGFLVISDEGGSSPPSNTATEIFTGFNITWDESRAAALALVDPTGAGIDYVDWRDSNNTDTGLSVRFVPYGTAFGPDIPRGPASGQSLGRSADSIDTDAAADWEETGGINANGPTFGGPNTLPPVSLSGFLTR